MQIETQEHLRREITKLVRSGPESETIESIVQLGARNAHAKMNIEKLTRYIYISAAGNVLMLIAYWTKYYGG